MKVVDRLNRWLAFVVILLFGVRATVGDVHHHCDVDQHCIICSALPQGRRVSAPKGQELRQLRSAYLDPNRLQRRSILAVQRGEAKRGPDDGLSEVPKYTSPHISEHHEAGVSRGPPIS